MSSAICGLQKGFQWRQESREVGYGDWRNEVGGSWDWVEKKNRESFWNMLFRSPQDGSLQGL